MHLGPGKLWGSSQMLQQGSSTALDKTQAQVAKRAMGAVTMALNRSEHQSALEKGETVGFHLQQAWQQV